jgi:hypothetical protein
MRKKKSGMYPKNVVETRKKLLEPWNKKVKGMAEDQKILVLTAESKVAELDRRAKKERNWKRNKEVKKTDEKGETERKKRRMH